MTLLNLNLLHIDDDPFELEHVERKLVDVKSPCSFSISSFADRRALFKRLQDTDAPNIDVVLVDIHLVGDQNEVSGLQVIEDIRTLLPHIVIVARSSDMRQVVDAVQRGASDFIVKRDDEDELPVRIFTAYCSKFPGANGQALEQGQCVSIGSTFDAIAQRIPRIIGSAVTTVHLAGETGVGKSMVANAFRAALKPDVPFLTINCGAITPSLLESELFGHVRGAFTGALTEKSGYLEAASGGWLFLDEIASLSMNAQAALLLAIENQEIMRVGDHKPRKIKTKILSATNENLADLVTANKFRKDFWQRLCEAEIHIKPLRERPGEIGRLAEYFCTVAEGGPYRLSSAAMEVLCSYDWREGNVRELRNCIRAMTERHINKLLVPIAIPERIWLALDVKSKADGDSGSPEVEVSRPLTVGRDFQIDVKWNPSQPISFDELADMALAQYVKQVIVDTEINSLRKLSMVIGLARSTLAIKLKQLIDRDLLKRTDLIALNSKEFM